MSPALCLTLALAQPLPLSLEEAMRRAGATSEQVDIAEAALQRARGEQLRARGGFFPQLAATLGYEHTLESEFDAVSVPAGGEAPAFLRELPFGREHIYRAGLSASQILFAGGRLRAGAALAASARRSAELGVTTSRAKAVLDAAEAYYDAVLAEHLFASAGAALTQAEQTFAQARLGHEAGNLSEFELLRAQVAEAAQRALLVQRRTARALAFVRLRQLLALPRDREVALTTSLDEHELGTAGDAAQHLSGTVAAATRTAVRQVEEAVQQREAALTVARADYLPALRLVSQYGKVGYPERWNGLAWDELRTNWTVGVELSLALFAGGATYGAVLTAEADLLEAQARLRLARELAQLEAETADEQLAAARAAFAASRGATEQARRAYDIAEVRYRSGLSTQLELSDARLQLQQAEANRAQAARDLEVAHLRLALLAALPLGELGEP